MKIPSTLVLAALAAGLPAQDHGQGPVGQGPIRIDDLDLGKHWFGPKVTRDDLLGKVVLFELWGS